VRGSIGSQYFDVFTADHHLTQASSPAASVSATLCGRRLPWPGAIIDGGGPEGVCIGVGVATWKVVDQQAQRADAGSPSLRRRFA